MCTQDADTQRRAFGASRWQQAARSNCLRHFAGIQADQTSPELAPSTARREYIARLREHPLTFVVLVVTLVLT